VKEIQRDAAAARADRDEYSLLRELTADNLVDRLDDTLRKFPHAAEVGCADGAVLRALRGHGRAGIKRLIQCDSSAKMLALCRDGNVNDVQVSRVLADEEALPFPDESLDLVLSNMALHWINDVPGTLIQIRNALRPDGLMLASMIGGDTLFELRRAMVLSGMERYGGVSASLSPLAGVQDAGNLLGRAGFALPAVDIDTHTFTFPDAMTLMHALQGMGENNAIFGARVTGLSRDALLAAAATYDALYKGPEGVPATFQVIYMSGWAPHASQQVAKTRGTAELSLHDLGTRPAPPRASAPVRRPAHCGARRGCRHARDDRARR
jgi:NADH dehydrogenase [ubiquinone] 1 alpha subcomplex assembly factor 5